MVLDKNLSRFYKDPMRRYFGMFRKTPVAGRGPFSRSVPNHFSKMPNHKLFWDAPTAREYIHGQGDHGFGIHLIAWPIYIYLIFFPWRYEIGDWFDRLYANCSDLTAMGGYNFFINEVNSQKNRAYQFMRTHGSRVARMRRPVKGNLNAPNSQNAWGAWDQETGRPIAPGMEQSIKLIMHASNPHLEHQYVDDTKLDMQRIREIRKELTEVRGEMQSRRMEMYEKVMV